MYNSRVQAASAVGSTREREGHEIRSKKTSPAAVLQDLLYKRGVKPKGAKPSQYYKTYYTEEEIKPKGDICHTTKFQVHKYYKTYYTEEEIKPKGDVWHKTFEELPSYAGYKQIGKNLDTCSKNLFYE